MGTSKRYAAAVDRQMDRRILERVMREHGEPETLTSAELGLDQLPLTRPPRALRARAWIRYAGEPHRLEVELGAWTDRVAAVRWPGSDDTVHRAWIWATAVEVIS